MHPKYRRYEIQFLEDVAFEAKILNDLHKRIFINACLLRYRERYNNRNQILRDEKYVIILSFAFQKFQEDVLGENCIDEPTLYEIKDRAGLIKHTFKKITPLIKFALEEKGYQLTEAKPWNKIVSILQESYFDKWYEEVIGDRFKDGWQLLWNQATFERIVVQEIGKPEKSLDLIIPGIEDTTPRFPWKAKLYYHIKSKQLDHFTLIQKSASGTIYCLAPSFLAQKPDRYRTLHRFPDTSGLEVDTDSIGLERVLAIVTRNKPELNWLPGNNEPPKTINETHLEDLAYFVYKQEECDLIKTEYKVIPSS